MTRDAVAAAGALVWRERESRLEVLVIHRPRYDDWSWPKGKLDPAEPLSVAAVREVAEETGLHVALGVPLPMVRYSTGNGRPKEVHYWAATELPASSPAVIARGAVERSVDEVDEMRWVSPKKAAKLLTRTVDRKPLKALVKLHESGGLATRAVVVVRHASAVSRAAWDGHEADRPLTPTGAAQTEALAPVLAAFGVESIVSSPWGRCAATVVPYARASGIKVDEVELLTEDGHRASPAKVVSLATAIYAAVGAVARTPTTIGPSDAGSAKEARRARTATVLGRVDEVIRGTVTGKGAKVAASTARAAVKGLASVSGGVALCTHRPVLPSVLEPVDEMAPRWVRKARPRNDPYLRPASVAVVHVGHDDDGPRVVSLEAHALHGAEPVAPVELRRTG